MELSELLKNSTVLGIELHGVCLVLIIMLYVAMRKSFVRNERKKEFPLTTVYAGSALMIVSDCTWNSVSNLGHPGSVISYIINLVYFLSSSAAAAYWFIFCIGSLETKVSGNKRLQKFFLIPYGLITILYVLSPLYGFIFTIQDGIYIRGSLFCLDPLIKMGYIGAASVTALVCGNRKKLEYLRKKDFNFALFGVPVLVCGLLQIVTGVGFNCIGVTLGLILIFIAGITNPDSENTDAIYSLANSFEASYIVNMDTGFMRPLRQDVMHEKDMPGMNSMDFTTRFGSVLPVILLPEDRIATLEAFDIQNIKKRFKIDSSFSIRYRVREASGQTAIHTAFFIRAAGREGRQEFLLGINTIHTDSLIYERNEALSHENQRLEEINTGIIESVAKIVEARDGGSGEHIVRVKKLTEIIAKEIMTDYPEYELDDEKVKLISSASVLHDVGKIVIPDAILLKPGRLTKEEFEIMKTHTTKGCDILNLFPLGLDDAFLECALAICRWHHEKYDGKGYPDGLCGDEIPIAAQIVSAADCYDALVSDRPYKKAFPPEKALEMIANGECGAFSSSILHSIDKQRNRLIEMARLYR